jgi:hypothetical protein
VHRPEIDREREVRMYAKNIASKQIHENPILRRIFGPRRDEVTGDWRKLHNEGHHNLYSSSNIIRMIKSSMRWAGHLARMGRRGMRVGYWWERQKERDHKEDQDVGGWTILK